MLAGRWDYDAFGNSVTDWSSEGGELCPFRFSTKYRDLESGLYYYGCRYYMPTDSRWLSRDPIAEKGGVNLYGFCGNGAVNRIDLLGHTPLGSMAAKAFTKAAVREAVAKLEKRMFVRISETLFQVHHIIPRTGL